MQKREIPSIRNVGQDTSPCLLPFVKLQYQITLRKIGAGKIHLVKIHIYQKLWLLHYIMQIISALCQEVPKC